MDYAALAIRHSDPFLVRAGFTVFRYNSVADHAGHGLFRCLGSYLAARHGQIAGHLFDEKLLDNGFPSALADNDRRLKMFPRPSGTGNAVQQRGPIKLPMAGGLFQSILWA